MNKNDQERLMSIPFKKAPEEYEQRVLFPTNVFDLLPEAHICFIYNDIFKQLDTSSVEKNYSIKGQHAYHPRLIVSILIYSYLNGVFSSRKIERECNENLSFMYISQINCPNFRVLSDFRKNNSDFFKECFKQTVQIAMKLGLVSLNHVSLDGSKFKANTSKHKAMSYKHLKEKEVELTKEIEALIAAADELDSEDDKKYGEKSGTEIAEELQIKEKRLNKIKAAKEALESREEKENPGKKIDDKKQISFADKDAKISGKNSKGFNYNYNGQISVDSDNQIIVGQHLSTKTSDVNELETALEEIENTAGKLPNELSADNGYMSGDNLEVLSKKEEVDAFIAMGKEKKKERPPLEESDRKVEREDFKYDKERDLFICPNNYELILKVECSNGEKSYFASHRVCSKCVLYPRCSKSTKGAPREITVNKNESFREAMREKMKSEAAKEKYKKRKTIVEPVFGQIKNMGFRGFSVRGLKKVSGEFSLICAVHNIKKIAKAIQRKKSISM